MAVRRITAAVAAALLCAGVAACGGDASSADPPPTATASPTPTASAKPTGPVAPVLPELAGRNDAVGAKAFVRFYLAALTHAMKTGDTVLVDEYAANDCEACTGISEKITKIYSAGGRNVGGGWRLDRLVYMTDSVESLHHLTASVTQPPQRLVDHEGKVRQSDPETVFLFNIWATQGNEGWRLREIQTIPQGK